MTENKEPQKVKFTGIVPRFTTVSESQVILPVNCGSNYHSSWKIILSLKGIEKLYDWQEECFNKALQSRKNFIYSLPTSGGKTLVSELLMIHELLCKEKDCLYVLPFVSIVQEKIRSFASLAVALNFSVLEYAADRGEFPPRKRKSSRVIYIATMEKAQGIVNSLMDLGRLSEIGTYFNIKSRVSELIKFF